MSYKTLKCDNIIAKIRTYLYISTRLELHILFLSNLRRFT